MFWIAVLVVSLTLMTVSQKALGNPLAFIGVGYLGFCVTLLGSVVLRMLGL